jgi:hypothetical protein
MIDCLFGFKMVKKELTREKIKGTEKRIRKNCYKLRENNLGRNLANESTNYYKIEISDLTRQIAPQNNNPKNNPKINFENEKEEKQETREEIQAKKEKLQEMKKITNQYFNHGVESHMELWASSIINNNMKDVPSVLVKFYILNPTLEFRFSEYSYNHGNIKETLDFYI